MFKNILVAVDGSEHSKKALNYAFELAKKFDSGITLIHVYPRVLPLAPSVDTLATPTLPSATSTAIAAKIMEEAKQMGNKILDEAELAAKERGISAKKILKEGDIVKEIVTAAAEEKSDLIVVGHRGLSKLKELLLGSVSEGVSHKAPCPVLIVK